MMKELIIIILSFFLISLAGCGGPEMREKIKSEIKGGDGSKIESENSQTATQTQGSSAGKVETKSFSQVYHNTPKYIFFTMIFLALGCGLAGWLTDAPHFPIYVYIGGWVIVLICFGAVFYCGIVSIL